MGMGSGGLGSEHTGGSEGGPSDVEATGEGDETRGQEHAEIERRWTVGTGLL